MKSFSPIKLFTPVMFFLVMCLTMISWGSYKTSEECQTSKRIEKKTECDNEKTQESKSFCYANQEKEISNYCSAYPSRSDLKDADSKCEAAIKDYRTKTKDANKVCTALKNRTTSSSKSKKDDTVNDCSKKIEECDIATKKASSANAENPEEQKDVFSDILSGMGGLFGSDANATSSSGS